MLSFPNVAASIPSHYEYCISQDYAAQKKAKEEAYKMMSQLDGWCSQTKAMVLMDIIFNHHPKIVVEVGIFGGKSFIPMAYAMKLIGSGIAYGIDPWKASESTVGFQDANYEWWSRVDHEKIYNKFISKLNQFNLNDFVQIIRSTSEEAPYINEIDLIHIDGNHSEDSALFDVKKWVPLVKEGGIIVFDDVDWPCTRKAIQWLDQHCYRITSFQEGNVWGIWIKR